jgi:hypothetical protein
MKLRPLVIDDAVKARIAEIVAYADAHPYYPDSDAPVPGDNPKYRATFSTYRCVYTKTVKQGVAFRHFSISVPEKDMMPNPIIAFTLAQEFGFTGWDGHTIAAVEGWVVGPNSEENCITFVQRLPS